MKNLSKQFIMFCVLLSSTIVAAQKMQSEFINYQGVARAADGDLLASTDIAVQMALRFGAPDIGATYIENHALTTDAFGMFSLQIGNGTAILGDFATLNWSGFAPFLTVSINGIEVGTTEMQAVPFAIRATSAKRLTDPFTNYSQGPALNTSTVVADLIFKPVGPAFVINKEHDSSNLEVFFNANCKGGNFLNGASLVRFRIRVDGKDYDFGNDMAIGLTNTSQFLSSFSVFKNFNAGAHTVQVFVRTNGGLAEGVGLDPGGRGGKIVVKETF